MFKTLTSAWKLPDMRKKILYTLLMLLVFRIGSFVPVPGVNVAYVAEQVQSMDLLGLLDIMSGGSLSNVTIFALGIMPYINASIIMQLLTIAIPKLEQMAKEGEDGRKKIASITRYLGVVIGLIQAIGIIVGMGPNAVEDPNNFFNYVTIVACLTAGTALIMWIGERITENGIGNGISLLIFIGIIARFPSEVYKIANSASLGGTNMWSIVLLIAVAFAIVVGIVFVDMGERRIPINYAKRVVGRKMYSGQSTYIPMKVNQSGVMPLIFAITIMTFPGMIAQFFRNSGFYEWYMTYFSQGSVAYIIVYALLILFFTYFYSQIAFNPVDVSRNLQQNGGAITGIRPGKPTSDYLAKILSRITFFGALFLALIAAVPSLFSLLTGTSTVFGATSLLIMVSVALETTRSIESQLIMRSYKGFLE